MGAGRNGEVESDTDDGVTVATGDSVSTSTFFDRALGAGVGWSPSALAEAADYAAAAGGGGGSGPQLLPTESLEAEQLQMQAEIKRRTAELMRMEQSLEGHLGVRFQIIGNARF